MSHSDESTEAILGALTRIEELLKVVVRNTTPGQAERDKMMREIIAASANGPVDGYGRPIRLSQRESAIGDANPPKE